MKVCVNATHLTPSSQSVSRLQRVELGCDDGISEGELEGMSDGEKDGAEEATKSGDTVAGGGAGRE